MTSARMVSQMGVKDSTYTVWCEKLSGVETGQEESSLKKLRRKRGKEMEREIQSYPDECMCVCVCLAEAMFITSNKQWRGSN